MSCAVDSIHLVSGSQIACASKTLGKAFEGDLLPRYVFPDEKEREKKAGYLFEFLIRYGIHHGEVYSESENLEGIAVWLDSRKARFSLLQMLQAGIIQLLFKAGLSAIRRIKALSDRCQMKRNQIMPHPHCYLWIIGVSPDSQGKGYAGRLLRHKLQELDREEMASYLETQSEKNVSLYRRYGYEVEEKITLPGTEQQLYCMVRKKPGRNTVSHN